MSLKIYRGDTKNYTLTFKDSNKKAIDLTSAAVWFTVKSDINDSDTSALIQKTVTSHTAPTSGETTMTLTSADTDITIGAYPYDFQLVDSNGYVTTLVVDNVEILQDVTQSTS